MSKVVRHLFALLLVAVMLFAVACSGPASNPKPTETPTEKPTAQPTPEPTEEPPEEVTYDFGGIPIRIMAWWNPEPVAGQSELDDARLERIEEIEKKFNVDIQFIQQAYADVAPLFKASILSGDPMADVTYVDHFFAFPGMTTHGFLLPVDGLPGFGDFEDEMWNKDLIERCKFEGRVFGFNIAEPDSVKMFFGMYFNKTIFQQEGLPNPYELVANREWTWDKVLEIAKAATKDTDGDGVVDQFGLDADWHDHLFPSFLLSNNAPPIVEKDGRRVFGLTEPNAIEALQIFQNFTFTEKVTTRHTLPATGEYAQEVYQNAHQQWLDGNIAMFIQEFWAGGGFVDAGLDVGFVPIPMGPKADDYMGWSESEGIPLVMPSNGPHSEETSLVLREYLKPIILDENEEPDPEAWRRGFEGWLDDEGIDWIGYIGGKIDGKYRVVTSGMKNYGNVGGGSLIGLMWGPIPAIISGEKSPAVAMQEIAPEAQSLMDNYTGLWKPPAR